MVIGRVYKIISTQGNEVYVGSTFNTTRNRFSQHKKDYTKWESDNVKYSKHNVSVNKIFEKYGKKNCKIILIKEYDVLDRLHLEVYETLWIYKLKSINNHIPFGIKKLRSKQYREQNKEKINTKQREHFDCPCGGKYTVCHKSRHMKTKKHQEYEKQIQK